MQIKDQQSKILLLPLIQEFLLINNGDVLDITGIVGVDGVRPAIDGGGTPGCTSWNCPGHRVFYVGDNAPSILNLTNVTIRNGYVCIYIYSTFNFFLQS